MPRRFHKVYTGMDWQIRARQSLESGPACEQELYGGFFRRNARSLSLVNGSVEDWSHEALLLTRISVVPMMCEPTVVIHPLEPFEKDERVHHKLFNSKGASCEQQLWAWVASFPNIFPDLNELANGVVSKEALEDIWETYRQRSLNYYQNHGFKQEWLDKVDEAWTATTPIEAIFKPPRSRRTTRRRQSKSLPTFETNIPHQSGEDKATTQKLTKRTRIELRSSSQQEEQATPPIAEEQSAYHEAASPPLRIPLRQASLDTAETVFSNSFVNTQAIRWQTFCNFMIEAGCTITFPHGGVSTKFTWTDPRNDAQRNVSLHKPHQCRSWSHTCSAT